MTLKNIFNKVSPYRINPVTEVVDLKLSPGFYLVQRSDERTSTEYIVEYRKINHKDEEKLHILYIRHDGDSPWRQVSGVIMMCVSKQSQITPLDQPQLEKIIAENFEDFL